MYSYDANGNLTGTSAGQSFTYDPFNCMTQAVGAGGAVTYTYNGDGLKVQRVGPDGGDAALLRRHPARLGDGRRRMILPASLDSIA